MKKILVATDFSTRSDQAVKRGVMLAKEFSASLSIVHVIDDDRPQLHVSAERHEAESLLSEITDASGKLEGVTAAWRIYYGEPFEGILEATRELQPDVVIVGPHRRQILKDVFTGTTAERAIRLGKVPFIMANTAPDNPYHRILLATDFSDCSADAARTASELGLTSKRNVYLMHVYNAPAESLIYRTSMTLEETKDYLFKERAQAEKKIARFARINSQTQAETLLKLMDTTALDAIRVCAEERQVDLIVVGTHGQSGLGKRLLGGVVEGLLRTSEKDVLAVPCGPTTQ